MGSFYVHEAEQPTAQEEGDQGVDEGIGEHPGDGVLAQLGYCQSGEPTGCVSEEVVGGDGEAGDLGQKDSRRSPASDGARAGGEHGRQQSPQRPYPEEVTAESVEEYAPEEAQQHGLEVPQRRSGKDDRDQGQPRREEAEGKIRNHDGVEERCDRHDDGGTDDGGLLHRRPLPAGPVDDDPHLFEVLWVHGRVYDYLLELVGILGANDFDLADVQPRGEKELLVSRPPAGNDIVALLGAGAEADEIDPEVSFEVGLEKPLAVRDVLRGEGRTELTGSRIELGGRYDPDPRREHLVRDEHDLGRMFGDLRSAPDERILTDHHGPVRLDAVFGTDVDDYPLGELVTDRGHDPGERPVFVGGPLPLQELAEAGVLALQA